MKHIKDQTDSNELISHLESENFLCKVFKETQREDESFIDNIPAASRNEHT